MDSALNFSVADHDGIRVGSEGHDVSIGSGGGRTIRSVGAVETVRADIIAVGVIGLLDDHGAFDRESEPGLEADADSAREVGRTDRSENITAGDDHGVGGPTNPVVDGYLIITGP